MCERELCAAVPGSDLSSPWEACGLEAVEGASPLCTSPAQDSSRCSGSVNFVEESLLSVPYGKPGHREVITARPAQT